MMNNGTEMNHFVDSITKDRLRDEMQATDEELNSLERLIKLQKEKMNFPIGSRSQPSVVIDEFLYHGDLGHAIDINLLLDLKICHIINLCECPLDDQMQRVFDVLWIKDLEDSFQGNIKQYFEETNKRLSECKENKEKVLVHCQAGISRSSSIVLAYLIRHHNYSLEKAYEYLLDRRPIAAPNYGFLIQLIRYEKQIQNESQHNQMVDTQNLIKHLENLPNHTSQW